MIESLASIFDYFRKALVTTAPSSITIPGIATAIPLIYARESSKGRTEATFERYPIVSFLDYPPVFDETYQTNFQVRYDDYNDENSDGNFTKAKRFKEPRRIRFKFDVTAFTKSPLDKFSVLQYFMDKYGDSGNLIFDSISTEDGLIGEVVSYKVTHTEVTRTDGVHEVNFEFILYTFVALSEGEEVDLVETLNLGLNVVGVPLPPVPDPEDPTGVWIMETGYWNDNGIWKDDSLWNEPTSGIWLLASGFWDDDGVWRDDAFWND